MFCGYFCYYIFSSTRILYVSHTQSTIFVLTTIQEQYFNNKQMKQYISVLKLQK